MDKKQIANVIFYVVRDPRDEITEILGLLAEHLLITPFVPAALCHRSLAQQSTLTVGSKSGHCIVCIVVAIALSNPWRTAIGSLSHKHLSQLVANDIGRHLCSLHAEQAPGQLQLGAFLTRTDRKPSMP